MARRGWFDECKLTNLARNHHIRPLLWGLLLLQGTAMSMNNRHVVVEDYVDALDVHLTAKQVGGNQDPLLEVLELLIPISGR